MAGKLERELFALRAGQITFAQFAGRVNADVDRLAASILRRFDHPPYIDQDDMRQEALIGVWTATETWEPGRGRSLRGHAVFVAYDRVRKALRKARGEDRANGNRARFERVARPHPDDPEGDWCERLPIQPAAEAVLMIGDELRARLAELGELGDVAFEALLAAGGDREDAAIDFLVDARNAAVFNLRDARGVIDRVLVAAAEAIGIEGAANAA